ncbi:MAG: DNA/RNA nuclease SfsA [Gammaproteobacteria bacterium]|nr:DNA/RNA nuclease SfsA [Gammaproteobacteria bacterium]
MKFSAPLIEGRLVKRYKRFLVDVMLADGEQVTAHCANTGSMKNCQPENARVWLSRSNNPKRKLAYSWELVEVAPSILVGINTSLSNRLVKEAIEQGTITELQGYQDIRAEVQYGDEKSRVDFLLSGHHELPSCYVEVKNVTLWDQRSKGYFPDAVTTRGTKHLRELMLMVEQGYRAVLCFCVQHAGIKSVSSADDIDPLYGKTLREAMKCGLEVIAYGAEMSVDAITLRQVMPVILPNTPAAVLAQ